MDLDPLLLSRIQFAFTISFHIIFPAYAPVGGFADCDPANEVSRRCTAEHLEPQGSLFAVHLPREPIRERLDHRYVSGRHRG
jgi:hypothetical protein